jgi:hypothetical protein
MRASVPDRPAHAHVRFRRARVSEVLEGGERYLTEHSPTLQRFAEIVVTLAARDRGADPPT